MKSPLTTSDPAGDLLEHVGADAAAGRWIGRRRLLERLRHRLGLRDDVFRPVISAEIDAADRAGARIMAPASVARLTIWKAAESTMR